MTPIKVGVVVEGHGEVKAVPILFRRIANAIDPSVNLEVLQPIRRSRGSLVNKPDEHELERAVELAALKARPRGGVFVLLDSDDDCPAELAPRLLARAVAAGMGLTVSVILPQREFEGWFLAAAESIRGKRDYPRIWLLLRTQREFVEPRDGFEIGCRDVSILRLLTSLR